MIRPSRAVPLTLGALMLLATTVPARALVVAPPPGPQRVAQAETVLVGRVVALEDKDMEVPVAPGNKATTTFRIALVAVTEPILGARNLKLVRVGFQPPPKAQNPGGGVLIRPIRPGIRSPQLEVGLDGLFFLRKHPAGDFHIAPMYYDIVRRTEGGNFEKQVQEARQVAAILNEPMKGLKSADAEARFQTAAMLVARYRSSAGGPTRLEPIPAEESKLILKALLESQWKRPRLPGRMAMDPWSTFNTLGLTAKDGWTPPKGARSIDDFHNAAQAWLRRNADTYRIQRFVPAAAAER